MNTDQEAATTVNGQEVPVAKRIRYTAGFLAYSRLIQDFAIMASILEMFRKFALYRFIYIFILNFLKQMWYGVMIKQCTYTDTKPIENS